MKASEWLSNADDWGSDEDECQNKAQSSMEQDEDGPMQLNELCSRKVAVTNISAENDDSKNINDKFLNNLLHMSIADKNESDVYSSNRARTVSTSSSNSSSLSPTSMATKISSAGDRNANPSKSSGI